VPARRRRPSGTPRRVHDVTRSARCA
jgi:hypothetical protein